MKNQELTDKNENSSLELEKEAEKEKIEENNKISEISNKKIKGSKFCSRKRKKSSFFSSNSLNSDNETYDKNKIFAIIKGTRNRFSFDINEENGEKNSQKLLHNEIIIPNKKSINETKKIDQISCQTNNNTPTEIKNNNNIFGFVSNFPKNLVINSNFLSKSFNNEEENNQYDPFHIDFFKYEQENLENELNNGYCNKINDGNMHSFCEEFQRNEFFNKENGEKIGITDFGFKTLE